MWQDATAPQEAGAPLFVAGPTVLARALVAAGMVALFARTPAFADVSLELDATKGQPPSLFSDGMVLQRETSVPIWGKAGSGESVSVSIHGQTKTAVTADNGTWRVELDPLEAGGPYQMTISGNNTITIDDVLIGDVWICAGQSNLVIRRTPQNDLDQYPNIHTMGRSGTWTERPSAMAFAFGRELHLDVEVPIGLVNRAAGGTAIKNWLSPSAISDPDPDVQSIVAVWDDWGDEYQRQIQPLAGYAIRGVLYWQGEQDLKVARQKPGTIEHYHELLPALIRSWRADWQSGNIPFVVVQLPTGGGLQSGQTPTPLPELPPEPGIAVNMRQATFNGISEPATALAVSVDIEGSVHPKDHDLYGYRLAAAALGTAYGYSFEYSGPIYSSMTIEDGNRVRLKFRTNTADGLHALGGPLAGFSISGNGTDFVWAQAEIQGDEVVVWNDAVASPSVVHYAWDHRPTWANLFNVADLGAAPFSSTETPAP